MERQASGTVLPVLYTFKRETGPLHLEIDHDGAAAAAVFYAVIDEIPEHASSTTIYCP